MDRADTYISRLLPEYVRSDDDGTLAAFLAGVGAAFRPALRLVDLADPDTSVTGTAEVANPEAAPRPWLPWLAWIIGVDLSGVPEPEQRTAIAEASTLRRRGSIRAIIRATQSTLTGSRSVRVYPNPTGSDPYLIRVVTVTAQTPDEPATLAAALREKPAGIVLDLQVVPGATYDEAAAEFDTYADAQVAFADYDEAAAWIPSP